ncbi:MAG: AraC family transcriptional regulator [Defluviitaleaceae bacterium]|nr:AraC family transcriptional regulator [Defluviitaleaceae bacterium]
MKIVFEQIPITDDNAPIKTLVTDSKERNLHSLPHIHDMVEVIYMMDGEMEFIVEDAKIIVKAGDIIIINSLCVHWSNAIGRQYTRICLLQFNYNLLFGFGVKADRHLGSFIYGPSFKYILYSVHEKEAYAEFARQMLDIADEFKYKRIVYNVAITSGIYRLLVIIFREGFLSMPENNDFLRVVSEALNYVKMHFNDNVTLEDIAKKLNISIHHFCRLFKKATGHTFIDYLNYYRVSIAKAKLLQADIIISEVFADVGFNNHSYFNRVFKKYTGFSPTKYRQKFASEATED